MTLLECFILYLEYPNFNHNGKYSILHDHKTLFRFFKELKKENPILFNEIKRISRLSAFI